MDLGRPPPQNRPHEDATTKRPHERANALHLEGGGLYLYRPLLDFSKAQLVATCQKSGVEWHEDVTNTDKNLTTRNTIRHLLNADVLPAALRTESLLQLSRTMNSLIGMCNEAVEGILQQTSIVLHTRSGTTTVEFPKDLYAQLLGDTTPDYQRFMTQYKAAQLMRRILYLVSPVDGIQIADLELAVSRAFPGLLRPSSNSGSSRTKDVAEVKPEEDRTMLMLPTHQTDARAMQTKGDSPTHVVVAAVKLSMHRVPFGHAVGPSDTSPGLQKNRSSLEDVPGEKLAWSLERTPPTNSQSRFGTVTMLAARDDRPVSLDVTWTDWQLFDGRFWIRIRYQPFNQTPGHSIVVRFLKEQDVVYLRNPLSTVLPKMERVEKLLKRFAPGKIRFTLPVIIESSKVINEQGEANTVEKVCALPSLLWGVKGWSQSKENSPAPWQWEIRYKKVDITPSDRLHSVRA